MVRLAESLAPILFFGRCHDGADDTVFSLRISVWNAIKGLDKINHIMLVVLQAALTDGSPPKQLRISYTCTYPRLFLHLKSSKLALLNFRFLVSNLYLTKYDIIIGLPVLRHS